MFFFRSNEFRIGIVLVLIASTIACSSIGNDSAYFGKISPPEGQVLRYITGAEPQTLDPQFMTGQPESRIGVALFDGLVEYEERTMNQRPSLATSWDTNANGTVWTFHLRNDAKWSDGQPLNAHDFVYSWRRAVSPDFAASFASLMYVIQNAQAYNEQAAFVRDPQTGKFATEEDLKRAGANGAISFTGAPPTNFDALPTATTATADAQTNVAATTAPQSQATQTTATTSATKTENADAAKPPALDVEKYLHVPSDNDARGKLLNGDASKNKPAKPELARFIQGKEIVPVTKENVGVRALDDYTFQVTLEGPTAYFVKLLYHNFFRPVPRQAIEKWGNALWVKPENIVTSGAFRLAEWRPYEEIIVVRNKDFWDNANTKLDKIIFPATESLTTAMNLYKSGEIDCTQSNEVPPPWRKQIKATKKDYKDGPYLQMESIAIKTTLPALKDPRVRRALSMAINRQILADQAPGRIPTSSFVPKMEGYENGQGTDYNPEEARRLLAEAGYPGGRGFPELDYLYNSAESNKQTAEFYQQMFKKELGIKVNLVNQEWRVYLENTRADKLNFNGFARWAWIGDYVDPNTFLDLATSGSDNNRTAWKDPKYDAMLATANSEVDPAKRSKMLHDAEEYMLAQQPMIPVFIGPSSFLCKPYVKNLVPNLLDQHDWRQVYIDHAGAPQDSVTVSSILPRLRYFDFGS